ncbi:M81 family metallopeptidase [Sphingomonas colocasiae]|uniref:Microcystinase C n=1 Tax=Sphingomonas colocasiae TaxID=1848973 RepID=A0ABS7PU10_9SPHN|nr:M81 family metallopeptidase [Sphingomonas colocasiae]MBY8824479.1 M81 family metallopeptidase [Sphingomonas colocasiae]
MSRIALGGFGHETNSFVSHRADFAYFCERRDRPPLVRGADVIASLLGGSYPLSGFVAAVQDDHMLLPLVWAHGSAGGCVTDDAFERIVGEMMERLSAAMPVDALYLDLHGAMVTESLEDAEGEILRRARAIVGDVPIVASLDYHANVTPEMVEHADALEIFRTYPHVDRPETGRRAAETIVRLLRRGRPAGRALRKPGFLIPATSQCTLVEPSRSIAARSAEPGEDMVALGYAAGFPPSDLFWCGPAIFAYGWTQQAADSAADALAALVERREADFASRLLPADAAIREALALSSGACRPVVVADAQDNPGGGGSGDTTGVLRALIDVDAQGAVLGIFCDADAARAAHAAGEGAWITLDLGGRSGPAGVAPIHGRFLVKRLGSGRFRTTGSVAGGVDADLGAMALLGLGGIDIVLSSRRMQAYDRAPFEHVGVDLPRCDIVVVKSAVHFRAEFEPLAQAVILAAAPGGFLDDPAQFPFKRLRPGVHLRPMGPAHVPSGDAGR